MGQTSIFCVLWMIAAPGAVGDASGDSAEGRGPEVAPIRSASPAPDQAGLAAESPAHGTAGGAAGDPPTEAPLTTWRVVLPDFRSPDDSVDEGNLEALTSLTVLQLRKVARYQVVSGQDIADLLRLEAERQTMGCDDDSSCLREIADAMNAKLLVSGSSIRLGPRLVVQLTLLDVERAAVLARADFDARNATEIPGALRRAVQQLTLAHGGIAEYVEPLQPKSTMAQWVTDLAAHPDLAALTSTAGLGLCSAALPCIPGVPLAQGMLLQFAGQELTGRRYPNWWIGTLSGYGALAAGITGGALLVAYGNSREDPIFKNSMTFAGGALVFATLFAFEPLAVWSGALVGSEDLPLSVIEAPRSGEAAAVFAAPQAVPRVSRAVDPTEPQADIVAF